MLSHQQFKKQVPGQLRMFMTGPEIEADFGPHPEEREPGESDSDVWHRKLYEASKGGHYSGGRTLRESIDEFGVQKPVEVWHGKKSMVAEGHHRVAVAAADIPEQYVPVEHYSTQSNWFA